MPAPRKLDRPIDLHVVLPETLMGEITVTLFSSAHGRIPKGKLSGFLEEAARLLLAVRQGKVTVEGAWTNAG